jgi:putative ABC transport system permease protein
MILDYLKIAFYMIRAKPVRSALSLLGIYIGILALVLILSIQEAVRQELEDLYRTQGAQVVLVFPGFNETTHKVGQLSFDHVRLLSGLKEVESTLLRMSKEEEVKSPSVSQRIDISGVDESFVTLYRLPLKRGRLFLPSEVTTRQPVCLLTQSAAQKLFPYTDPLNGRLAMLGATFQVIGIVDWQEATSQRTFMQDVGALVPFTWLSNNGEGMSPMTCLEVRMRPDIAPETAVQIVKKTISHDDSERAKLYLIMTLEKFFQKKRETNEQTRRSLLAIAAVSLLVGGIGVANVMLTSVTERTREVGLRKALGARRIDILMQFLVESSVLSATGGLLAGLSGWIIIGILPSLVKNAPHLIFPQSEVAACLLLTLVIGLIAGLYPASRAAALQPAEALRYE